MNNQDLTRAIENLASDRAKKRASELISHERSISAIIDIDDIIWNTDKSQEEHSKNKSTTCQNYLASKESSTISDSTICNRKTKGFNLILFKDFHANLTDVPSGRQRLKVLDMVRLTKYTRSEVFRILLTNEKQIELLNKQSIKKNHSVDNQTKSKVDLNHMANLLDENPLLYNRVFMRFLNLEKIDILSGLRNFTRHVHLSGESQNVERGLKLFAREFYRLNSKLYKSEDDVFKISYSLILLNTMIISNPDSVENRRNFILNTLQLVKNKAYESELSQYYRSLVVNPLDTMDSDCITPKNGLRNYVEAFEGEIFDYLNAKISKWIPNHKWRSHNPHDIGSMKKRLRESMNVTIVIYRTHIKIIRALGNFQKIKFDNRSLMNDIMNPIYLMHAETKKVGIGSGLIFITQKVPEASFYVLKVKGSDKFITNLVMKINFMSATCSPLPRKYLFNRLNPDCFPLRFDCIVDSSLLLSIEELTYKERIYSFVADILFKFFTIGLQSDSLLSDEDILFQSYLTTEINRFNNYIKVLKSGLIVIPKIEYSID